MGVFVEEILLFVNKILVEIMQLIVTIATKTSSRIKGR